MKKISLILLVFIFGCQSLKKDIDFTFFKWNIHEAYYLKIKNIDTLYLINAHPLKKSVSYTLLSDDEKNRIITILDTITFPKNKISFDSDVEDGTTYAFLNKKINNSQKLRIHGKNGPEQFWKFGDYLDEIKSNHKFILTTKKNNFSNIDKLLTMPIPPIVK